MLPTATIRVLPRYKQNFNPNIITIPSKVINYNSNTLIYPKINYNNKTYINTPTITVTPKRPYTGSQVYSYNQNYQSYYNSVPRARNSQSLTNIHNLATLKITHNPYKIGHRRGSSTLSSINYTNPLETHTYSSFSYNYLNQYNNYYPISMSSFEPDFNIKLNEYAILNQIGQGSEGVIYTVRWKKNNKNYAMKKCEIQAIEDIKARKQEIITMLNYINSTGNDGILKTFGCLCVPNMVGFFDFYEIMELAEKDWEKEIGRRQINQLFYSEYELMEILRRLVGNFSSLQTNHITHRDIKPQNIMFVNGVMKICDFGNAKILKKKGIVVQRIRGSELFMSPKVFKAYHAGMKQIQHNTFKSDVFSLGLCFLFAGSLTMNSLYYIREINDTKKVKECLNKFLEERYSIKIIEILMDMLQIDENLRLDFISLEKKYFLKEK